MSEAELLADRERLIKWLRLIEARAAGMSREARDDYKLIAGWARAALDGETR